MRSTPPLKNIAGAILAVIGFALAGCGPGIPPPVDKDQAIKSLNSALAAWQKGDKPEDLKKAASIQMYDTAWDKGLKLTKFEIDDTAAKPSGFDLGVPVRLWFGNEEDGPRTIKYTITTSPAIVITRDYGGF